MSDLDDEHFNPQESEDLFRIIGRRKDGKTILFISHKLKEIMQISDNITVWDGKVVDTVKEDADEVLARLMVGRDVFLKLYKPKRSGKDFAWECYSQNEYHHPVLNNLAAMLR